MSQPKGGAGLNQNDSKALKRQTIPFFLFLPLCLPTFLVSVSLFLSLSLALSLALHVSRVRLRALKPSCRQEKARRQEEEAADSPTAQGTGRVVELGVFRR